MKPLSLVLLLCTLPWVVGCGGGAGSRAPSHPLRAGQYWGTWRGPGGESGVVHLSTRAPELPMGFLRTADGKLYLMGTSCADVTTSVCRLYIQAPWASPKGYRWEARTEDDRESIRLTSRSGGEVDILARFEEPTVASLAGSYEGSWTRQDDAEGTLTMTFGADGVLSGTVVHPFLGEGSVAGQISPGGLVDLSFSFPGDPFPSTEIFSGHARLENPDKLIASLAENAGDFELQVHAELSRQP